jgi:hypothetical protein
LPLAHRVSISGLAQLVRAACRPVSEFASKYRATSFTFLAWLLALETYKFANMYNGPHPAGPESTIKGYDSNGTDSSSHLDPAKDGQDYGSSIAGSDREQHAKVDDGQLDRPHADADLNNHPATAVGSSTDPRILSEFFSSNPTISATAVSASADLGSGIKGNGADTSGTFANQTAVLQVVVNTTSGVLQIDTTAPAAPTVALANDTGSSSSDSITSNGSLAVTPAEAGGTIQYSTNGGASWTGSFTAVEGVNNVEVRQVDAAGNNGAAASFSFTLDTTAPTVPSITSITLGGSGGNHWVLAGKAEANSNIAVFDGGTQIATVTTSGLGAWNYTTTGSVTNSSAHTFRATASDLAGNTSASSAAWIEGSAGNDTLTFGSEAQLTAPIAISGNGGADTISMTAPVTLNSGDFANVSGVQSLQLTGASTVTLGADAATAGIVSLLTGNGATSITNSNGVTLNVDATALADNTALSLSGTAGFTVTGLQGDLTATSVSGPLNVTTVAVASGLSIATGSGANAITATALTTGQVLTLTGSSAATVTLNAGASSGNLAAGADTGNLTVTGGTGANTITVGNGTNTITGGGGADVLTGGTGNDTFNFSSAANLGAATTIAGGAGNDTIAMTAAATLTDANFLHATSTETLGLTGASTITLGANAASAGLVNVITGNGATSITDSNGVTLHVDTTALANNTALTLVGSSAEVVTGLIGNITANTLTGALTVTTGDATDNTIAITTGSAATSITDNFNTDTVTVTATALAQNTALTLTGSAAEVVTGLVGDIAAGLLTGALTVTTGNAADNGISITTGSAATSITASGAGDTVTVNATALTANTLTLTGSAAATVTLGTSGNLAAGADTGNLTVTGGSGANTITVGSGTNTITGGGGADVLTGGSGSDHFVFNATSDSTVAAKDSINNFTHGSDVIDTSAIAGITAVQGLISGATQIAPHSIAWIQSGADTIMYANNTGVAENQAAADMAVTLKSITASVLTGSDFIHH